MIDELMPIVQQTYVQIGSELGIVCLEQKDLVDFFPTPQMRLAFLKRFEEDPQYLRLPDDEHNWDEYFRYDLGYGVISPCWLVDLPALLAASRKRLLDQGRLWEERFDQKFLIVGGGATDRGRVDGGTGAGGTFERVGEGPGAGGLEAGVQYKDIQAGRLIFCDGVESFTNPYFSLLPFAPNKGEALILDIPELGNGQMKAGHSVFKKGISLAPWKDGLYWAGSSYEWSFEHGNPTEAFRTRISGALKEWLKLPFEIVEHIASVRPATLERRPFVGFHPRYPAIGILNGMGTKGCSLAPYFASQLVQNITGGIPIQPDADVKRFSGVLRRG
jgi:hypothetical protein